MLHHALRIVVIGLAFAIVAAVLVTLQGSIAALPESPISASTYDAAPSSERETRGFHDVISEVPPYSGEPSVHVHGDNPLFFDDELSCAPLASYAPLDSLGRCGQAIALIGLDTMPDAPRDGIGMIKPSGWHTIRYDWVDGGYLYNRCHLIAYQLTGENDNELNLITGTRSMNVLGMQPYETEVASYVRATGNHVLYRVTPVFEGDNLVASGVIIEAQSIEDNGAGVRFCVWCYNAEPGVSIDYSTGESNPDGTLGLGTPLSKTAEANSPEAESDGSDNVVGPEETQGNSEQNRYSDATLILNVNTHRFHLPTCPAVQEMEDKNKRVFYGTREEAIAAGFKPCGICGDNETSALP